MRIEFLGTPGAGKTTLYLALAADLRSRGFSVLTREDLGRLLSHRTPLGRLADRLPWERARGGLLHRLARVHARAGQRRFAREHSALLAHVQAVQARRPAEAGVERRRVLPQFLNMAGKVMALRALSRPGEVLLLDEACTHRVVQFYASHAETPDPHAVRAYLDLIPSPEVLVWVDAPLEVCLARVHERGVWEHSRHLSGEELARFLAHAQTVTRAAAEDARRRGWPVIAVRNAGEPHQAAAALSEQVRQYLG